MILMAASIVFFLAVIKPVIMRTVPGWAEGIVGGALSGAVTGGVFSVCYRFFDYPKLRMLIRAELNARGVPVCMKCGYDLRGQLEPRCPECGTAAAPPVRPEPS